MLLKHGQQCCVVDFFFFSRGWVGAVYRAWTAVVFHKGILHLALNMLALVPIASPWSALTGSLRTAHGVLLFSLTNSLITAALAYGARLVSGSPYLVHECGIGFSGVIFSFLVLENGLNAGPTRRCVLVIPPGVSIQGSRAAVYMVSVVSFLYI